MRSVIQRVITARVLIAEKQSAAINRGLVVFLGVAKGDTDNDAHYLAEKITNLRIFDDEAGKMNKSLMDINGDILIISQFTLLGDCQRGRRPSFTNAEEPISAEMMYKEFIRKITEMIPNVAIGKFQAEMKVELINDGPVTIILDSKRLNKN